MKQRLILIYLLTFLLSIFCVSALNVGLTIPGNGTIISSYSTTLSCVASENPSKEILVDISLRIRQKGGVWWTSSPQLAQNFIPANFDHTFPAPGDYEWNCLATNNNSETFLASQNNELKIEVNTPPEINSIIPNQEESIDTSSWVLYLSSYAEDNEDLTSDLTWNVSGVDTSFCNVEIISGDVAQFTPSSSASAGSDTITFTVIDTGGLTGTQDIIITLTATTCTSNWGNCTSWSDCSGSTQTRTCTDLNNCDPQNNQRTESRSCSTCDEDWDCDPWSDCDNGYRTRTCTDDNDCETTDDKPTTRKSCTVSQNYILEITSSSPSSSKISMLRGTSKTFRIDTNLIDINIKWYLDNNIQSDTDDDFRYSPLSQDIGNHTIKVIVEDGDDRDAKEWEVTVTQPVTINTTALCGNNKIDTDENCITCPQDSPCFENETCDEGICRPKGKTFLSTITGFATKIKDSIIDKWYYSLAVLVLIILTMLAFTYQKKKEKKSKPLSQFEEKRPLLSRIRKTLREWDKKHQQKTENKTKVKQLQKERKEEIRVTAPSGLNQIITFINEYSANGYSRWQIIKALRTKGWSRTHIKEAFRKAQKHDSQKPAKPD